MSKMRNGKVCPTLNELESYAIYVSTKNDLIDNGKLKKVLMFIETMIDPADYEDDFECLAYIHYIYKYTNGILVENLGGNESFLIDYICGNGNYHDRCLELYNSIQDYNENTPMSTEEIIHTEEKINGYLTYRFLYEKADDLKDDLTDFSTDSYSDFKEITKKIEEKIRVMHKNFSKVNSSLKDSINDFDSNGSSFFESLKRQYNKITNPSTYIKTSVKMLNEMLGGGLESERLYVFAGKPGGWKSGQLLNLAMDAKHYNVIEPKDPTKEPAILYITQENSINETIERIWSYYFSENDSMKNYTYSEVEKKMTEAGFNQGTRIFFKYRTSKSISCSDIESYIDEFASRGYEICLLIHDYTKRLRPNGTVGKVSESENMFAELGYITDELNAISKDYHIPVVSAAQLNRSAYEALDNMNNKNPDSLKKVNNSAISESTRLVENVDYLIMLDRKTNPLTLEEMITYKATKKRGNDKNNIEYFAHPFENKMKLKPDIDLEVSLSVNQLSDDIDKKNATSVSSRRAHKRQVEDNNLDENETSNKLTLNDIMNEE